MHYYPIIYNIIYHNISIFVTYFTYHTDNLNIILPYVNMTYWCYGIYSIIIDGKIF